MGDDARAAAVTWAVVLVAAAFVALLALVPLAEAAGAVWPRWLRAGLAPLCHQRPERSLTLAGLPLPVCARCTGLYAGGVAGLALGALAGLGAPRRRWPRARWFWIGVTPTLADGVAGLAGLPALAERPRAALAGATGAIVGLYLALAVRDAARSVFVRRRAVRALDALDPRPAPAGPLR
jgi:uncharacterized membrane protein